MRANDLREQLAKKDHDIAVPTDRMGFEPSQLIKNLVSRAI